MRAVAVLLPLLLSVSAVGLVMFGVVLTDEALGPGAVFTAVALAGLVTALAGLPGLVRGTRTGWLVVTGWVVSYDYWTVYKVFGEQEYESASFLVVGLLLAALLLAPSTRRYAGA